MFRDRFLLASANNDKEENETITTKKKRRRGGRNCLHPVSYHGMQFFFSHFFLIISILRAFPQHLTMKHMDADDVRIYIREPDKNIFYQLEDMK